MTPAKRKYDPQVTLRLGGETWKALSALGEKRLFGEKVTDTSKVVRYLLDLALRRLEGGYGLSGYLPPEAPDRMEQSSVRLTEGLLERVRAMRQSYHVPAEAIPDPELDGRNPKSRKPYNLSQEEFVSGLVESALLMVLREAVEEGHRRDAARGSALRARGEAMAAAMARYLDEQERALPQPASAEDVLWREFVGQLKTSESYNRMRTNVAMALGEVMAAGLLADPGGSGAVPGRPEAEYKR